jgi:hypothetical protein
MSLPTNTSYTLNGTTYVEEPKLDAIIAAVTAKCIAAGRSDLIPATNTRVIGTTTYIDGGLKLADLEDVLKALGATGPADVTTFDNGRDREVQRWGLEQILTAARSIGC